MSQSALDVFNVSFTLAIVNFNVKDNLFIWIEHLLVYLSFDLDQVIASEA